MVTETRISQSRRAAIQTRIAVYLGGVLCAVFLAGCGPEQEPDRGANQSLVEIGERSFEDGEEMESRGRLGEAHLAYRRSLWAFRYHEQLTGEEPILLDEALEGLERTTRK